MPENHILLKHVINTHILHVGKLWDIILDRDLWRLLLRKFTSKKPEFAVAL